jgi:hypothetical protein
VDLNYFLYREQVSLMRADGASSARVRQAHLGLANAYRRAIKTVFPVDSIGTEAQR